MDIEDVEDVEESRTSLDADVDGVECVWLLPAADVVSNGSAVSCDEAELELDWEFEGWRSEDDIMTSLLAQEPRLLDGEEKSEIGNRRRSNSIRAVLGRCSPVLQSCSPARRGRASDNTGGEGQIPVGAV